MKAKFLALTYATAMSLTAAAYVTNIWQNASGGSWGETSNWSLGRVPTYDDWVELPSLNGDYTINVDGDYQVRCVRLEKTGAQTVTLTGNGSITSGVNDCYVRDYRALILDGPSFIMTKADFMLYGPLTVKNGSVLRCVSATLWLTAPALHVESGGNAIFSSLFKVRASTSVIDINGGTFQSPKITRAGGYTNCGSIRVSNGGSLSADDKRALGVLFRDVVGGVLGLKDEEAGASGKAEKALDGVMGLVLDARKKAREEKNWAESDRIRDTLASFGITVKDTKEGATWTLE